MRPFAQVDRLLQLLEGLLTPTNRILQDPDIEARIGPSNRYPDVGFPFLCVWLVDLKADARYTRFFPYTVLGKGLPKISMDSIK